MYDINALCFIYQYDDDGLWRARHGKVETKVDFFSLYAVQVTINDFFFFLTLVARTKLCPIFSMDSNAKTKTIDKIFDDENVSSV